jgi:serine/threonine protein kinase
MTAGLFATDPVTLGPYRLLGRLGGGGMGQVFLARSPGGRLVAVKVIRPEFAADPEFRVRFAREVANARTVSGIFTAALVDADADGPVPWLATAYIPGPPLSDVVRGSGPLPTASLLPLAAGLAEALAAIHDAGVVHRDLKPSNVLLASDGPRVIDFGISYAVEASALTQSGAVMGSPGYMSPEQAQGRPVGPASDVFSLGAVLAFAATGAGPFGGGSVAALVYRVVSEPPDLDRVPPELRPLVERCLAKAPGDRPGPRDLLAELGGELIPENWLPETVANTLLRYEPSARIAALASGEPPPTDSLAPQTEAAETPVRGSLAPQISAPETLRREIRGQGNRASAALAPEMSAFEGPAPEAPELGPQALEPRADAGIAITGQATPPTAGPGLSDQPSPPDQHGLSALLGRPWLRQHRRAATAVVAMAIAAVLATWLALGADAHGGHTGGQPQAVVTAGGSTAPTSTAQTSGTTAPSEHGSPKAPVTSHSPASAASTTRARVQPTRQAVPPTTATPSTSTPPPSLSVDPAPSASPISGVSIGNDPSAIVASEVSIAFGGCTAWLDNDGSGNLSGMLNTSLYQSCDAELYRSGGPAISLSASWGAERTSAVSDTGHTMWICVWQPGDQAGQQCSPLFGMNGDVPTQQ